MKIIKMITLIVNIISIMISNVLIDYILIDRGHWIRHGLHVVIATAFYLLVGYAAIRINNTHPIDVLSVLVTVPAFRWFVHDMLLNKLRGLPLGYLGSSTLSSGLDKMLGRATGKTLSQWEIKLIFLWLSLVSIPFIQMLKYYF